MVPALIAQQVRSRDVLSGIAPAIALRVKVLGCCGDAQRGIGTKGKLCGELINRIRRDHWQAAVKTETALTIKCVLTQLGKL